MIIRHSASMSSSRSSLTWMSAGTSSPSCALARRCTLRGHVDLSSSLSSFEAIVRWYRLGCSCSRASRHPLDYRPCGTSISSSTLSPSALVIRTKARATQICRSWRHSQTSSLRKCQSHTKSGSRRSSKGSPSSLRSYAELHDSRHCPSPMLRSSWSAGRTPTS